jgi:hypothetical protein
MTDDRRIDFFEGMLRQTHDQLLRQLDKKLIERFIVTTEPMESKQKDIVVRSFNVLAVDLVDKLRKNIREGYTEFIINEQGGGFNQEFHVKVHIPREKLIKKAKRDYPELEIS